MSKTNKPHGAICRTLRTIKGLTQADAARVIGGSMDGSAVSRFESSGKTVSVKKLVRVMSALDADVVIRDRDSGIDMLLKESEYPWNIDMERSERAKEMHRRNREKK